jgi:uncharacterized damage-inducible protein DinB
MHRRAFAGVLAFALMAAATPGRAQTATGFQADLLNDFSGTSDHLIQLADAIPADKYGWRPRDGVRSVSEVFVHIASANYLMLAITGAKVPAEYFPGVAPNPSAQSLLPRMRELQKIMTQKDQVSRMLKASLDQFRDHFSQLTPADLEKPVDFFGSKTTVRGICLRLFAHDNEHYGQMIAYARVIGVVPPWSK